ncbi:MAG: LysE family translocator [Actinomycetota bacterium]
MPDLSTFAVFCLAALALLVIPGPSVLYIVTRSIHQGRAAGMVSMLGIHVGTLFHVAAAALGLSALLMSSAVAFATVKYLGAAYLIFLGIRTLLAKGDGEQFREIKRDKLSRIFTQGIVVNVLNPKTALFFFAFLPQFADPARGSVALQIVVLGVTFILLGIVSDGTYGLLAARLGDWLKTKSRFARAQRIFSGSMYVALGVGAALSGSSKNST